MINIAGLTPVDDPSYCYKIPTIISKVEGRGNGIKTVLVNIVDVATSLNRDSFEITKFFDCELGAQTTMLIDDEHYIVNGAHSSNNLQQLMFKYIELFVLCCSCRLLETHYKIKSDIIIYQKCVSCEISDMNRIKQKKNKIEQEKCSLERQINAMEEQRTYLMNEKSKLEDQLTEYKHKVTVLEDSVRHLESSNSTISSSYGQKLQTIRTQFQSTTTMLEQIQIQRLQQENTIQELRTQLTTIEEKYSTLKKLNKQLLTATDTYESILKRRDSVV